MMQGSRSGIAVLQGGEDVNCISLEMNGASVVAIAVASEVSVDFVRLSYGPGLSLLRQHRKSPQAVPRMH